MKLGGGKGSKSQTTLLLEEIDARQQVKITCGVEGCRRSFSGRFDDARRRRDQHRLDAHPDWRPRRTVRRGFGKNARRVAFEGGE